MSGFRKTKCLGLVLSLGLLACQSNTVVLRSAVSLTQQAAQGIPISPNRIATRYTTVSAEQETVPGEWIVKWRPGVRSQQFTGLSQMGLQSLRTIGPERLGLQVVKSLSGADPITTRNQLQKHPEILWAEPNTLERLQPPQRPLPLPAAQTDGFFPNDPFFAQQYGHALTHSREGWQIYKGSSAFFLAVIDSGLDLKHPDLQNKLVPGYDIIDQDNEPWDGYGHGTHCAGIAAALSDNNIGIAGYAPEVKIMPVRVIGDNGIGDSADVAAGIIWAVDHGAKVLSMSLGGLLNPQVKREAVQYALDRDVVIVAAMGNNGKEMKSWPAATPGVLAVGASDSLDQRAAFSQYGDWISVTAPGVQILSTLPTYPNPHKEQNYGLVSGTSMATPAVAGVAALIRSRWPNLNREEVKMRLERGADDKGEPGFDTYFGHGRLNLAGALRP